MRTPEQLVEDNAAIALFYGAEYKEDDYGEHGYWFKEPFYESWHTGYIVEALRFHKSWDWIMPVVKKIKKEVNIEDVFQEALWHNICLSLQTLELHEVNMCVVRYIEYQNASEEE